MIIGLPKRFELEDKRTGELAYIENGVLKLSEETIFRKVMIKLTYMLKGENRCYYCGKIFPNEEMTVDHFIPLSFGGPTISENLVPACKTCNGKKRDMTFQQYQRYLQAEKLGETQIRRFLFELFKEQEEMRKTKEYIIPKDWIVEKPINDIIINDKKVQNYKKYNNYEKYYYKYGIIKNPIVVDRNNFLLDGFLSLMVAEKNGLNTIPTIVLENVEVIQTINA